MRALIGRALHVLMSAFLALSVIVIAALILQSYQPIWSPISPVVSGPAQVITGTLAYGDALATYENVATRAISASDTALDIVKWLVPLAAAIAGYLYKTARDAEEQAKSASESAKDAQVSAADAVAELNRLSQRYIRLSEKYVNLSQRYIDLKGTITSLDAAMQARLRGEISNQDYIAAQQWHSYNKWIQQHNELGYHELHEQCTGTEGLTSLVQTALELELAQVDQRAVEGEEMSEEAELHRRRLRELINPESIE